MVTVLLLIFLAMLILGIIGCTKISESWLSAWLALVVVGAIGTVSFGAWDICELEKVATSYAIEQEIAMYEEENAEIEAKMEVLVKQYMEFEKETLGELKSETYITLISYYPELKSDELVQRQLDVYEENSKKLKSLRKDLINVSKSKWRVYFGH
jgi:hypothetical protein